MTARIDAAWLTSTELQAVFRAFADAGSEARVVGGAVRNTLMGLPVTDFDLATPSLPDDIMRIGIANGFAAHPTGIAHGTVTLVVSGKTFEVTTLRSDVETDGRRATVAFTTDWAHDAARRDFTINALYCAKDGSVYDFATGLVDLADRRIRFIGSADTRIREDYLRILRFFRFNAQYCEGTLDADGLAACVALKDGLKRLSAERVHAEVFKLLVAPRAVETLGVMQSHSITAIILPTEVNLERLARLADLEQKLGRVPNAALRLAALAATTSADAQKLSQTLKLSNAEYHAMRDALALASHVSDGMSDVELTALLYRNGRETTANAGLLAAANAAAIADVWVHVLRRIDRLAVPVCPVNGTDVISLGISDGPQIGQILARFESQWLASGADENRQRALVALEKIATHSASAPL
jgi:poly(A) polymerase